jgi:hypothetical protein
MLGLADLVGKDALVAGPSGPVVHVTEKRGGPDTSTTGSGVERRLMCCSDAGKVRACHAGGMTSPRLWIRSRGLGRLLAQETNISDLLQFLSDRDSTPWAGLIGFVPASLQREANEANHADLLLVADDKRSVVIEVKLAHVMDVEQQKAYEDLESQPELILLALSMDKHRVEDASASRWRFLSLAQVFDAWRDVPDEASRVIAREASSVLGRCDTEISSVFKPLGQEGGSPLSALTEKFLVRVVTRRIGADLRDRGVLAVAGVSSGGGLPLVEAWKPIRNEGKDRCFIAEVRWWETKPGGELRFGVDFDARPGLKEDEEVRRAAYTLAQSMDQYIDFVALKKYLEGANPRLAELISREGPSRPGPAGDWEQVIRHGFTGSRLEDGKKDNRRTTRPAFYGDGALRFQAIANIDFGRARAHDITDLLDETLTYLAAMQPA